MNPSPTIRNVLVVGAGSIGIGVARSFAAAGVGTTVVSRNPARLAGQLPGAAIIDQLPQEAPDLVVESVPENIELKHDLFARIEEAWDGEPVIATNTSSLPLEDLATILRHPDRFIGTHYLFPADAMEFVEVTCVGATSKFTLDSVVDVLHRSAKTPIVLRRPVIGALVNRLQHALLREAYSLLGEGVVTAEDLDDVARRLLGPRMCVTGLLEQKDISGLDTHALAQRTLLPHLHNSSEPTPYLQDRYARGELGLKSGRGFYDWEGSDPGRVRAHTTAKVGQILAFMEGIGVGRGRSLPE